MLFIPYTASLQLARTPWLTIGISLLCVGTFVAQTHTWNAFIDATESFCSADKPRMFEFALKSAMGATDADACTNMMLDLRLATTPEERISRFFDDTEPLAGMSVEETQTYFAAVVHKEYRRYEAHAPDELTADLDYRPSSWNPWRMVTSTIAHGGWVHLIGNVLFFIAFAATVEVALGSLGFLAVFLGSCLFNGAVYSIVSMSDGQDIPTIGLSGIVMTMMALLAFLIPFVRIRCFVWIILVFRTIGLPAWLLALWYVSWDLYYLLTVGGNSGVNFSAHVSGAAFGILVGAFFCQKRKDQLRWMARQAMVPVS